jgi:transposase
MGRKVHTDMDMWTVNRPGIPGDSIPWKRGWSHGREAHNKEYPPELKERAVKMVQELRAQDPHDKTVISRVARQLGVGDESLRAWVKRAEVDAGKRPGLTTDEQAELKRLRKENFELRRSNDILQSAATFFGAELDRRGKK